MEKNKSKTTIKKDDTGVDRSKVDDHSIHDQSSNITIINPEKIAIFRLVIIFAGILLGAIIAGTFIVLLFRSKSGNVSVNTPKPSITQNSSHSRASDENEKESTQIEASNTSYPTYTPYPTNTLYPTNTSPPMPKTENFIACSSPCNDSGANIVSTFPERTTRLYVQWTYSNFPIGADYIRKWTMNGREWVRYECYWPGPESGIEDIKLWDVDGLHSGEWQVTIIIDGVVVMQESIFIQGDWDYWSPAGTFNSCYGQR